MRLKHGVRIRGIRPELVVAMMVCNDIYEENGLSMTVTSVVEGTHSTTSLHYSGAAFDLRTRGIDPILLVAMQDDMKLALEQDFDIILESDHFHIEYQPKGE